MPPFIPKIDGNYGLHNFDKEFTEISLVSPDINSNKKFKNFENFTWEDSKMVAENPNVESLKSGTELTLKQLVAAFEKSAQKEINDTYLRPLSLAGQPLTSRIGFGEAGTDPAKLKQLEALEQRRRDLESALQAAVR